MNEQRQHFMIWEGGFCRSIFFSRGNKHSDVYHFLKSADAAFFINTVTPIKRSWQVRTTSVFVN